jgi:predicted nucleic acid-binding protein
VVSRVIVLDAGPLGAACNPLSTPTTLALAKCLQSHLQAGAQIVIPEIADYEVRRELLRGGMTRSVVQLDQLAQQFVYLPLTTAAIRKAAEFWAQARQLGMPTAADPHLDCDVILAAQAAAIVDPQAVVATTNAAHISRFVAADHWQNIQP